MVGTGHQAYAAAGKAAGRTGPPQVCSQGESGLLIALATCHMSTVMQLLGQVEEQGWSRVGVRSFESSSQSAAGLPLVITAACACSILLHNGYSLELPV